jgi:hypothetical protein
MTDTNYLASVSSLYGDTSSHYGWTVQSYPVPEPTPADEVLEGPGNKLPEPEVIASPGFAAQQSADKILRRDSAKDNR